MFRPRPRHRRGRFHAGKFSPLEISARHFPQGNFSAADFLRDLSCDGFFSAEFSLQARVAEFGGQSCHSEKILHRSLFDHVAS
jgi:hypothetical protein